MEQIRHKQGKNVFFGVTTPPLACRCLTIVALAGPEFRIKSELVRLCRSIRSLPPGSWYKRETANVDVGDSKQYSVLEPETLSYFGC